MAPANSVRLIAVLQFKDLQKAYDILSDTEKRSLYDRFGEEAAEQGHAHGHGGGGIFEHMFGMYGNTLITAAVLLLQSDPHTPIIQEVVAVAVNREADARAKTALFLWPLICLISTWALLASCPSPVKWSAQPAPGTCARDRFQLLPCFPSRKRVLSWYLRAVLCSLSLWRSLGGKPGAVTPCTGCRGRGVRVVLRQLGPGMVQQMQMRCPDCKGEGERIKQEDLCKVCTGEKTVQEQKVLEVFVEKGMRTGDQIRLRGEGNQSPDADPGDVVCIVKQKEHPIFRRDGASLFMRREISLYEALAGFSFHFTHLDGRVVNVKSQPGVIYKPGDIKAIENEGMPEPKRPLDKGYLFVELQIVFPPSQSISAKDRQLLPHLLPSPAGAGAGARSGSANATPAPTPAGKAPGAAAAVDSDDEDDDDHDTDMPQAGGASTPSGAGAGAGASASAKKKNKKKKKKKAAAAGSAGAGAPAPGGPVVDAAAAAKAQAQPNKSGAAATSAASADVETVELADVDMQAEQAKWRAEANAEARRRGREAHHDDDGDDDDEQASGPQCRAQ